MIGDDLVCEMACPASRACLRMEVLIMATVYAVDGEGIR